MVYTSTHASTHASTRDCLKDLAKRGELIRLEDPISPYLDIAELTRRMHQAQGPALLFENVEGTEFPVASNIFGTSKRAEMVFERTFARVQRAIKFRANPIGYLGDIRNIRHLPSLVMAAWHSLPKPAVFRRVLWRRTTISSLPQCVSWPGDGGAFLTLPQVLSLDPERSTLFRSNMGMYRIQISGGEYEVDQEIGLHYQLHRGIGIHHTKALTLSKPLKIGIFLGGPPAHTMAAVMPMPENLSELIIAGMLAGRGVRWSWYKGYPILCDADFCILGEVDLTKLKEEGPFGDHLGYYSLRHAFPYLKVKHVFCRRDAVMPITVVGRPPQEDSIFGSLIHRLTVPMVPVHLPGVKEVHAVDDAGVHPLLLAIGSERYVPYKPRLPMEVITQAFAILGFNQCSLAKYLFIAAREDNEELSCRDVKAYFAHVLARVDLKRDLHLLTSTPIDTLDYSSGTLNFGSKLVVVCAGAKKRQLSMDIPQCLDGVKSSHMVMPGVLAISVDSQNSEDRSHKALLDKVIHSLDPALWHHLPLVVVSDDSGELARDFRRFLWETFTRSHPADDLHGKNERFEARHWVFDGPLFVDARSKKHIPDLLVPCPESVKRVDAYVQKHAQLKKWL